MTGARWETFPDADALFRAAAEEFVARAARSPRFTVALSGGSTPRGLYALLASDPRIEWGRVHLFWGDERCVPPDDPESNYRMARETLLGHVRIPEGNIHRIRGEDGADAAETYEREIRAHFHLAEGEMPCFDLVLLGLGEDGHTASLFPGSGALKESRKLVVATRGPKPPPDRITLTLPVLNHARCDLFLVTGDTKADALAAVRAGDRTRPASLVHPTQGGDLLLFFAPGGPNP